MPERRRLASATLADKSLRIKRRKKKSGFTYRREIEKRETFTNSLRIAIESLSVLSL
jgi:hypothetical protein